MPSFRRYPPRSLVARRELGLCRTAESTIKSTHLRFQTPAPPRTPQGQRDEIRDTESVASTWVRIKPRNRSARKHANIFATPEVFPWNEQSSKGSDALSRYVRVMNAVCRRIRFARRRNRIARTHPTSGRNDD